MAGDQPKAPLAPREVDQRLEQFVAVEVRPVGRRGVVLGVGRLPQQEVAQAHLARRANHQVWVGLPGGVQVVVDQRLVNLVERDAVGDDVPERLDQVLPPAIVEGDVEDKLVVVARQGDGLAHLVLQRRRKPVQLTDVAKLHAVRMKLLQLAVDDRLQDVHQPAHLGFGPPQFSVEKA